MSTYNDGTWEIIQRLTESDLQIAENSGSLELRLDKDKYLKTLPKYCQQASTLIVGQDKSRQHKYQLADRYGVDRSVLSKITSGKTLLVASQNVVLCSLFRLKPLPTVAEVNHTLMKLRRPGLFTDTSLRPVNRRNWVIIHILEYGQKNPCPMDSWQDYANAVLNYFNMELLSTRHSPQPLSSLERSLIEQWRTELNKINCCDYSEIRNAYFDRFLKVHDLNTHGGKSRAYGKISAKAIALPPDRVKTLLGRMTNPNSGGSRDAIIELGIGMGCSLRETNRMLLQRNERLLYPNQSDEQELNWVKRLRMNEIEK